MIENRDIFISIGSNFLGELCMFVIECERCRIELVSLKKNLKYIIN